MIQVYYANPDQLLQAARLNLLNDVEHQRALCISRSDIRIEFVGTRALLRLALAKYLGRSPRSFQFDTRPNGKPFLTGHSGVHFSVSHSAGKAMISIASVPIGIDIEHIDGRLNFLQIAKCVFSPPELEALARSKPAERVRAFFSIWTRKEAYLKATGDGFSSRPELISVVSPGGWVEDRNIGPRGSLWRSVDLSISDQLAAALATPFGNPVVRIRGAEDLLR